MISGSTLAIVRMKEAFDKMVSAALPLTEYVIKKLTADNDLSSQDKKVKLLNEVEPILEQMKAPKLNLLFRKRIAQLVGLDIQEINNILGIRTHLLFDGMEIVYQIIYYIQEYLLCQI